MQDLICQVFCLPPLSGNADAAPGAYADAFAAGNAAVGMRANRLAPAALHAKAGDHPVGFQAQPFRIVTPVAPKRTTLHKHRSANARPVKQGKFFDIKEFDIISIYASEWNNFVEITDIYDSRTYISCREADELIAAIAEAQRAIAHQIEQDSKSGKESLTMHSYWE